jgi:5-methyltetrahydrofolate--homocysteine methyltransferase
MRSTLIEGEKFYMADLNQLSEALQKGDIEHVKELTGQALSDGFMPGRILTEGLIAGMDVVGLKFKNGDMFIPEVLIAAKAMHAGLDILKPRLVETGIKPIGTVALGTVKGDLHDIGKNMVGMMLQGAGFEVIDLGVDCPPEKFVEAASENNVQLIGMSALLTTTMLNMKETITALQKAGLPRKVKTMIGGAVVSEKYANEIGADAYAPDASSAVDKARQLIGY